MPARGITYSDIANPLAQRPLSEDELDAVRKKQEVLDKLLAEAGKAKFKIEVLFSKNFSLHKTVAGAISFWESGTKLHGGGDAIMHICPGKKLGRSDCDAFIPDPSHGLGFLVCPRCLQLWDGEQVYGQVLYRLPLQRWADVLEGFYLKLQGNADLVMKRYPGSLRQAAENEQKKQQFGESLGEVRGSRQSIVYPLANIIKDTSAGASLNGRILAFLRS